MKLLLDTADVNAIREMDSYLNIDGVTTNPKILAAAGRPPFEVLHEIRDLIGPDRELHVQAIARDCEGILTDSARIRAELGENTFTKVAVTSEGLKAIRAIKAEGHNVLGTAVYNTLQAWLAGRAGADYVAPYVNRIDNLEMDGCEVAMDIHDVFQNNGITTKVMAASFKNVRQLLTLVRYGLGAATVDPAVLKAAIDRLVVDDALKGFEANFAGLVGEGRTLADL